MTIATFAIGAEGRRVEGDFALYPNKVVFRAGDYPEHRLSLSAEEMAASVGRLAGSVAGNIQHTKFLAGKAVFLDAPRIDPSDPLLMRADVRVPLWLDEHLGDHEKKLSAEWNRDTKDFAGVALCVNPAIPEADLMATFAKAHSTPHGTAVMQRIHDHAAGSGAICQDMGDNAKNANAMFVSRPERAGFQKIHDHAVENGAKCPGGHSYFTAPDRKGKPMSLFTKLTRLIGGSPDVLTDDETTALFAKLAPEPVVAPPAEKAPEAPTADFTKDPAYARLVAENAQLKARGLDNDAKAWADAEVAAKRALPAEKDGLVALFVQATADDAAEGSVAHFTEAAKKVGASRVEMLKAVASKRPAHMLFEETITDPAPDGAVVVENKAKFDDDQKKVDPKEIAHLKKYLSAPAPATTA